jgi:hypothetical protein
MSTAKKPTAIEKRAQNPETLAPFALDNLKQNLPLVFPRDPDLPPSPKPGYRSAYRYLGFDDLNEETIQTLSPFEIAVRLFDYRPLEPLLAAHIYVASAKGAGALSPGEYVSVEPLPAGAEPLSSRGAAYPRTPGGGPSPAALHRI